METRPIPTSRAFRGRNFMTGEFVRYLGGTLRGGEVHVEISKESPPYFSRVVGGDPNGGPLIGVTFARPNGTRLDPDPSKCCASMDEAVNFLSELT